MIRSKSKDYEISNPKNRKAEIINAARKFFQIKGYDKVTMQELMDSLNIAKGTIYHYFKSKEALFEAVIENIVETNIGQMEAVMQRSSGTALEKIQILMSMGNISLENKKILKTLHAHKNDAMHARLLGAIVAKQSLLYANLINQGCEEGIFQTTTPRESAEFILAAIQFLTDVGIYPWTQEDLMRRAKAFPAIIENLLKAPKGSFDFLNKLLKN